ncbi:hypothetical protein [Litorilinea aerophila]|nr:hypothetical protein [Litorilinea aerophila]GIV77357.1 MAG: hypothetical protein KatS3mg050_1751 [Litorilinea sp.]
MEVLYVVLSWGSPFGIGLFFTGLGLFFWGFSRFISSIAVRNARDDR